MARGICEGCQSLDVRQLHRKDLLQPGLRLPWSRNNELAGTITIETEHDALMLIYRSHRFGPNGEMSGNAFQSPGPNATLAADAPGLRKKGHNDLQRRRFFCLPALLWPGLREPTGTGARTRHTRGAENQGALGRGENILAPFPDKPKGMHWRTYDRLRRVYDHAFERSLMGLAKSVEWMERWLRTQVASSR
jgi:hypothetical protein